VCCSKLQCVALFFGVLKALAHVSHESLIRVLYCRADESALMLCVAVWLQCAVDSCQSFALALSLTHTQSPSLVHTLSVCLLQTLSLSLSRCVSVHVVFC